MALDEAAPALTVSARLVTRESQAAAAAFAAGDRMVVTWSGARGQADGIRQVRAFDDSGLWGGDRFLLPATFERVDGQVLTFTVPAPAESVADIRQHSRGDWATLTSPHRPATAAEAVTAFATYGPAAPTRPRPTGTYQWHAELVALDELAGRLTVKAPIVSSETLEGLPVRDGDPIVITWSGYGDRADGIRQVRASDGSGLWGSDRFLLPATFEALEGRSLIFTVRPPAARLELVRGLLPGEWTTVTSPHQGAAAAEAVVAVDAYDPSRRAKRYVWPGELVAFDAQASAVSVTVPAESHLFRYVDRFAAGDQVLVVWAPGAGDAVTAVRYMTLQQQTSLGHGYILPAEFLAADAPGQQITLRAAVPAATLGAQASLVPGSPIQVTSPLDQGRGSASILTVQPAAHP